ncbi:MAG TPA: hypothetical protein VFX17_03440 [Patescibacteria group bacterium]|nr:hypothetical protein [Patescibacteria group bacterium]
MASLPNVKLPHLSFRTITSAVFILIVLVEVGLTLNYIYKYLSPAPVPGPTQQIVSADLKSYNEIFTDLRNRANYEPQEFNYVNPHPFKYGP